MIIIKEHWDKDPELSPTVFHIHNFYYQKYYEQFWSKNQPVATALNYKTAESQRTREKHCRRMKVQRSRCEIWMTAGSGNDYLNWISYLNCERINTRWWDEVTVIKRLILSFQKQKQHYGFKIRTETEQTADQYYPVNLHLQFSQWISDREAGETDGRDVCVWQMCPDVPCDGVSVFLIDSERQFNLRFLLSTRTH